jgi:phosphoribosylamine--glycine ligase
MLTPSGPKVVEYNCRFGDPETQVVVPLYHGDFAALLRAACEGKIDDVKEVPPTRSSAVCVVLASEGYPDASPSGKIISGLDRAAALPGVVVFHAGTRREANGTIVTAGGRVLGVTAVKEDGPFSGTIHAAYEAVECIGFEGMHFRHDIGKRAL